ncbi:hypothetical protein A3K73_04170 [Candidatus Pacearchaeota archaeon RBG_13_36_9]|nr:MAG: hypothetical protein A3K73_04170 [Candidatus Pacearchaeota archaeon RBG_13_36_9]
MGIIDFQGAKETQEKEKKDKKELEERIKGVYNKEKPRIIYLHYYLQTRSGEYKGVLESPVPMSFLPHGDGWEVRGEYDPRSHSLTYGIDLPFARREHTREHEIVHSKGERDEHQTDRVAESPYYHAYAA